MMLAESSHPSASDLAAFARDGLPNETADRVDAHLAGCAPCRQTIRDLRGPDPSGEDPELDAAWEDFEHHLGQQPARTPDRFAAPHLVRAASFILVFLGGSILFAGYSSFRRAVVLEEQMLHLGERIEQRMEASQEQIARLESELQALRNAQIEWQAEEFERQMPENPPDPDADRGQADLIAQLKRQVAALEAPHGSLLEIDLFPRGSMRGGAADRSAPTEAAGARTLILRLLMVDSPNVWLEILDPADRSLAVLADLKPDDMGMIRVAVPRTLLRTGRHRLKLYSSEASTKENPLAEYWLDVR